MGNKDYNADVNDESESGQSRLNAAGLINATLERLWSESYNAMANSDFSKWNIKLDSIWAILGGDVKPQGKVEIKINDLDLKIYGTGSLSMVKSAGFKKEVNPNRAKQYHLLKQKSLFLRRLQNKQGKGTAYADDDEDDWD